ncbi:hypothetical protein ACG7TL_005412 [Trametes sanguinea]
MHQKAGNNGDNSRAEDIPSGDEGPVAGPSHQGGHASAGVKEQLDSTTPRTHKRGRPHKQPEPRIPGEQGDGIKPPRPLKRSCQTKDSQK